MPKGVPDGVIPSPCPKCGGDRIRRNGGSPLCKPCIAAKMLARYHTQPEVEKIRMKRWRDANREQRLEGQRRWREANQDRITDYNRAYYEANRESEIARCIAYIKAHPEVDAACKQRRKALKEANICDHGVQCVDRVFLATVYSAACQYCGEPATHADHFVPLSRGGLHCRENIVPACTHCNTSKWAHDPVEWMAGRASRKQIA